MAIIVGATPKGYFDKCNVERGVGEGNQEEVSKS